MRPTTWTAFQSTAEHVLGRYRHRIPAKRDQVVVSIHGRACARPIRHHTGSFVDSTRVSIHGRACARPILQYESGGDPGLEFQSTAEHVLGRYPVTVNFLSLGNCFNPRPSMCSADTSTMPDGVRPGRGFNPRPSMCSADTLTPEQQDRLAQVSIHGRACARPIRLSLRAGGAGTEVSIHGRACARPIPSSNCHHGERISFQSTAEHVLGRYRNS